MGFTADHIKPYCRCSEYEYYSLENLQAAHRSCNMRAGAKNGKRDRRTFPDDKAVETSEDY